MTRDALRQAIDWHIRLRDADKSVWEAFVLWLERDPANAAAYDEVSLLDEERRQAIGAPVPANDAGPARRWRPLLVGAGSLAACAVAALVLLQPGERAGAPRFRMVAAEQAPRALTVGNDATLSLAPGARMRLDPGNARFAALDAGVASFSVRHDTAHPFRLQLGAHELVDTGTVFRVENAPARIIVDVSEGGVTFDPHRADVAIHPGQRLVYDKAAETATLSADAAPIAETAQSTMLSFAEASFGEVTTALERATASRIILDPALKGRRFTGVLRLTGSAARDVPHFAEATGTRSTRDGDHWLIGPAEDGSR
jgi:transmembrane sensor